MDRIEAMSAFVATVDAGGFSRAARRLGRSPASITRAVAFLEERTGSQLLRRSTRMIKITEAGERYLAACRKILAELAEAEQLAMAERAVPRGLLTITAPAAFGRLHIRPLVDDFLELNREVRARLLLLDRVVNLVDEGVDVALRIAHLPDSSLLATRVGEVRRIACASPAYLEEHRRPKTPQELAGHRCISFSQSYPGDVWTFAAPSGGRKIKVKIEPRLTVNGADAAIGSALEGRGVTCVLSYQVERELREKRLVRLLSAFEPEPLPVHLVYPAASGSSAKLRAFIELAVPALRKTLSASQMRS